jgi:hypothetical protein
MVKSDAVPYSPEREFVALDFSSDASCLDAAVDGIQARGTPCSAALDGFDQAACENAMSADKTTPCVFVPTFINPQDPQRPLIHSRYLSICPPMKIEWSVAGRDEAARAVQFIPLLFGPQADAIWDGQFLPVGLLSAVSQLQADPTGKVVVIERAFDASCPGWAVRSPQSGSRRNTCQLTECESFLAAARNFGKQGARAIVIADLTAMSDKHPTICSDPKLADRLTGSVGLVQDAINIPIVTVTGADMQDVQKLRQLVETDGYGIKNAANYKMEFRFGSVAASAGAAPVQALGLLPESSSQPKSSISRSYACVKRSQAREGFEMDSPKAGVIEVGARARHSSRCRTRGPL